MINVVKGAVEPGFERLRDQFEKHFRQGLEAGAALAVYRDGVKIADLWGGTKDKEGNLAWQQDTLVNVFSTSKAVTAFCVQKALDQRLIDVDKPIAYYWPEYGCEGKSNTKVSWILNHRTGLPALKDKLPKEALFDWDRMTSELARMSPWWTPGTTHGYQMVTFGWLIGEVFKRAVGVTVGQYLSAELAVPLALDIRLGLDAREFDRVADLKGSTGVPENGRLHLFDKVLENPDGITAKALTNPPSLMTSSNKEAWRKMELPSANVHASAEGLAKLFGLSVAGDSVVSEQALNRSLVTESQGFDRVMQTETRFGPGFMLQQEGHPEGSFGAVKTAFGHPGSGGALAFGDPDNKIGFAYVMNQMGPYVMIDPRPRALVDELYRCLADMS